MEQANSTFTIFHESSHLREPQNGHVIISAIFLNILFLNNLLNHLLFEVSTWIFRKKFTVALKTRACFVYLGFWGYPKSQFLIFYIKIYH